MNITTTTTWSNEEVLVQVTITTDEKWDMHPLSARIRELVNEYVQEQKKGDSKHEKN
jgi:hypothetical protein